MPQQEKANQDLKALPVHLVLLGLQVPPDLVLKRDLPDPPDRSGLQVSQNSHDIMKLSLATSYF